MREFEAFVVYNGKQVFKMFCMSLLVGFFRFGLLSNCSRELFANKKSWASAWSVLGER